MNQVKFRIDRIAASLIVAGAALLGANAAQAQDSYPDRSIRLIVPFPPGGQTDNVSRRLGATITPILGQQLVIDNRSGASGTIGSGEAARAKVSLSDGTIIRLAPATEFELTELSPPPTDPVTQLKLTAGKMWVIVTKALGGGAFDIETPSGVATVRGSLMSTEFYPADGRMIVTCLDGQCRLQSATSGKFVDLSGGQQSGIPAYGRDPGAIITINVNQVSDWAREVPEAASLVATITPGPPPTETPAPAP